MLYTIAFTVADALLDAILMVTRCVFLLRMSSCIVDVLFSILCIPRVLALVQPVLWILGVTLSVESSPPYVLGALGWLVCLLMTSSPHMISVLYGYAYSEHYAGC